MIRSRGQRGATVLALMAVCVLAGCGAGSDKVTPPDSPTARQLDALALQTGALPDRARTDPVGRYGRRYEGGSDQLCLVPEDGLLSGRYRFGAEMRIGRDEYCRGRGSAKRSADKLLLRFDGAGGNCLVVARYEGDKIVLPGSLDLSCAMLCSGRGSFAGVSFPRVDRDEAAAAQMTDQHGKMLCR